MTTYKKNDRRQWRHTLKRLQWRINYALAFLAMLAAILVQPATANAAPACPSGRPGPQGECVQRIGPATVCAWPFVLVKVGRVTYCTRQTTEATQ